MKKKIDFIYSLMPGRPGRHYGRVVVMIWMFLTMAIVQFACYPFHIKGSMVPIAFSVSFISLIVYMIHPGFTYRKEIADQYSEFERTFIALMLVVISGSLYLMSFLIYFLR
jgi:hypothetical protein